MPRAKIDESHPGRIFLVDSYRTPERIYSYRRGESAIQQIDNAPMIGDKQYANIQTFRRIVVPGGVVDIGNNAFRECKTLTSIILPPNLKRIGKRCFCDCFSLEIVEIPDSVDSIDTGSFENCKNLRYIKLPTNLNCIKSVMFRGCTKLTYIEIPDTVEKLGWAAFYKCERLVAISLPDGIRHIPSRCFGHCQSLQYFTFTTRDGMEDPYITIGTGAFYNCLNLIKVDLSSSSVYSIGERCFSYCRSLESVVLSKKTAFISEYAFYCCDSLQYVGYEHTPFHEFNTKRLFGIDIKYVTEIENEAFRHCPKLEYIKLYDNQKLRHNVFDETNFSYISLPGNIFVWNRLKIFKEMKGVKEVMIRAKIHFINYEMAYEQLWELVKNNEYLANQPCTIDNLYPLEVLIGVLGCDKHPYTHPPKNCNPLAKKKRLEKQNYRPTTKENSLEETTLLTIVFKLLTLYPTALQYLINNNLFTEIDNEITL